MKNVKWVNLLKVRASYGENGNDGGMGWHAYADRYTTTYNKETKEYSITMSAKGNDNLTWETKKSWDFGVDFSLFKYRLNGTIEVYTGTTSDLLWSKTVPLSSGIMVASYPANIGSVRNSGIEVSLDGTIIKTKDAGEEESAALRAALALKGNTHRCALAALKVDVQYIVPIIVSKVSCIYIFPAWPLVQQAPEAVPGKAQVAQLRMIGVGSGKVDAMPLAG